jgi:hypothetical protein
MAKKIKAAELSVDFRLGLANLQQDTRDAARALKGLESSIKGIGGGFKALLGVGIGVAAFNQIKQLNTAFKELADRGDAASDIADNFKALGGSASSIDEAKKALLGTVSAFDLMKVANEGLIRGIPGLNENFSKLAAYAKRFAEANGKDVKQSLEEMTSALAKGKAKGLLPFGFALDETASKAKIQAAVFAQLQTKIDGLAEPADSVAEAQTALSVAMDDAFTKMGMGVNANENLTQAFRNLATQVDLADFQGLGNDLAELFSQVVSLASIALPPLIEAFNKLGGAIGYIFQSTTEGKIAGLQEKLNEINASLERTANNKMSPYYGDQNPKRIKLQTERDDIQKQIDQEYGKFRDGLGKREQLEKDAEARITAARLKGEQDRKDAAASAGAAKVKAEADAIQKIKEKWAEFNASDHAKGLQQGIEKAIETLDQVSFDRLKEELRSSVEEGFVAKWQDAIDKGAVSLEDVTAKAKTESEEVVSNYAEKFKQQSEEAYKSSIETWQGLFENAITGATFDLESALKQVAVGFAAQMAQAIIGNIGGLDISSPQGLGGTLAQSLLGSLGASSSAAGGGGMLSGVMEGAGLMGAGSLLGSTGMTAAQASSAGMMGPAMADGMFASGSGIMGAIGPALPYIAAAVVATTVIQKNFGAIEKFFGAGTQDAQTNARESFGGKLEEMIDKIGGLQIFGQNGQMQRLTDVKVGASDKFNAPDWADNFSKTYGKETAGVFDALGKGLQGILGIAEDVGGQIGLILAENLGGSVDNARLAVQQLGLSFEEFQKYFLEQAEQGQIRWSEYNASIAAVSEAFKPGLVAIAATKQAFDNLIASGGRGMAAVVSIKNAAVEGLEAGLKTVSELGDRLIAEGADPEKVKAMISAATERGLSDLKKLSTATNEQAGSIVGGMEGLSASLASTWAEMSAQIDDIQGKLESFPKVVESTLRIKAEVDPAVQQLIDNNQLNLSGGTSDPTALTTKVQRMATGGLVTRPTYFNNNGRLALAGESGLEAVMPLAQVNGKLGIRMAGGSAPGGSQLVINVDARGAAPGVEREVVSAIKRMKGEIQGIAVEAVNNYSRRGGH